mmetsp:Transcript_100477/g.269888  ORF Transcript_100477/g.269888 Transcript_100477/m.269888 type:complete len:331 (+) Transcript_100477:1032-2024(+)
MRIGCLHRCATPSKRSVPSASGRRDCWSTSSSARSCSSMYSSISRRSCKASPLRSCSVAWAPLGPRQRRFWQTWGRPSRQTAKQEGLLPATLGPEPSSSAPPLLPPRGPPARTVPEAAAVEAAAGPSALLAAGVGRLRRGATSAACHPSRRAAATVAAWALREHHRRKLAAVGARPTGATPMSTALSAAVREQTPFAGDLERRLADWTPGSRLGPRLQLASRTSVGAANWVPRGTRDRPGRRAPAIAAPRCSRTPVVLMDPGPSPLAWLVLQARRWRACLAGPPRRPTRCGLRPRTSSRDRPPCQRQWATTRPLLLRSTAPGSHRRLAGA